METLMSEASQKSNQMTSVATPNVISSLESADGASPCSLPDGPQTDLFGQALAPASHSAPQAKVSRKKTSAISGPCSSSLSASAALSMSLGSRLQARLGTGGSMEYRQTWKQKATPAGRPYWVHIPSTRPINDKDCTGWPTPDTGSAGGRVSSNPGAKTRPSGAKQQLTLNDAARLTGWPTPDTCAGGTGPSQKNRHAMRLQDAVLGWTTPNARDYKDSSSPEALMRAMDSEKGSANLPRQVATITGWTTPDARAMNDGENLETWDVRQAKNKEKHGNGNGAGMPIAIQCKTVLGPISSSSTAETVKPAASQLNPHFSRWLMGFPPEWCDCAVTAMQSLPKRRRSSSKPTKKLLSDT